MNANLREKPPSGELLFLWTEKPKSKSQKARSGEIRARSIDHARYQLSRQGVKASSLRKAKPYSGSKIPLVLRS
jgi:type IV pilus assembly protein PilC